MATKRFSRYFDNARILIAAASLHIGAMLLLFHCQLSLLTKPKAKEIAIAIESETAFSDLAQKLSKEQRWHELYDLRTLQTRCNIGLPIVEVPGVSGSPEQQQALQAASVNACIEAGEGLIAEGSLREAWFYLRAAEAHEIMRTALEQAEVTEENSEALIELALYEGAHPARGFELLIAEFGICNSVTTLEGIAAQLPADDLRSCAERLVGRLHQDLVEGLRYHINQQEGDGSAGDTTSISELIADRDWLFEHEAAHVDASHLASAVRFGRALLNPQAIALAMQLAEYGARLQPSLQYPDAAPFEKTYPAHLKFYRALLGEAIEEATNYFCTLAEQEASDEAEGKIPEGSPRSALEAYYYVLAKTNQESRAIEELTRLGSAQTLFSPLVPSPLELASQSDAWQAYEALMIQRGDEVGRLRGQLAQQMAQ